MALFGNVVLAVAFIFAPVLAVLAIIRGHKGIKMSKCFETENKTMKTGYWLVSAIHMWAGILIAFCYAIMGVLIIVLH